MFNLEYRNRLRVWQRLATQCFGYGFHVTAARMFAISNMIEPEWENQRQAWVDPEAVGAMEAMIEVCNTASNNATNAEQKIYIHMLLSLIEGELARLDSIAEAERQTRRFVYDMRGKELVENAPDEHDPLVQTLSDNGLGEIPF